MPLQASPHPHVINSLNGPTAPKTTFLVFYSSIVGGQLWCPDCRNVDSTVKAAFDGDDKPKAVILYVGNSQEWRTPNNWARKEWNVQSVPTILRMEDGKEVARVEEYGIMNKKQFQSFLSGSS